MFLFNRYKCPQCSKPWTDCSYNCECGYEFHAFGCPKCMSVYASPNLEALNIHIHKKKSMYIYRECECDCNYVPLNITARSYQKLENDLYKSHRLEWKELPIKWEYYLFMDFSWKFPLQKYLYDNLFDHNLLDRSNPDIKCFFAFLNPRSSESNKYFMAKFGESYESLYFKTHNPAQLAKLKEDYRREREAKAQRQLQRQQSQHTPKCPICGSTNLTKISTLTKAAKISAFGIYGAGDVGKTYKCNHCGVKF